MKEIEFRAWHKENREMVYFNNDKLVNDEYQRYYLACLMRGDYGDVLMQYTGLKDKNGAKIFEGDIVIEKLRKGKPEKVYYQESCASFQMNLSASVWDQEVDDYSEIEVIGNIYEHPDMITS